jgi:hypothetical protein
MNIEIKPIVVNEINIPDEYDTKYICEQIEKLRRVNIQAELPGSGKSYICQYMKNLGHNVLTVCPTNVLVLDFVMKNKPEDLVDDDIDLQSDYECDEPEEININSVTLNKFFGVGINDENNEKIQEI